MLRAFSIAAYSVWFYSLSSFKQLRHESLLARKEELNCTLRAVVYQLFACLVLDEDQREELYNIVIRWLAALDKLK